jgi:2-polyprenyl-3-methyl-5-hydroxy-6-metoxy-1,4-benzoquinol methylase
MEIFKGVVTVFRLFFDRLNLFRRKTNTHQNRIETTNCPACDFNEYTLMFEATSANQIDGSEFQCTNTHHAKHGQIVRCLGCGLIQTNPQLPEDQLKTLYSDVEDAVYLENAEARRKTFGYNLKRILQHLPARGHLLDVGCYCGLFLQTAGEHVNLKLTGVEPSRWAVDYCRQQGLEVQQGVLKELPPERFDVITSWDVLEHVSDPLAELIEVNSRLKPGGVYAFSTLNVDNWFPKLMGERWPWYMDMHLYYFTNDLLGYLLRRAGFEVVEAKAYCHIITGEYFLRKLTSLGVPFVSRLQNTKVERLLKKLYLPFRFGDIQLIVAKKVREADVEQMHSLPKKLAIS